VVDHEGMKAYSEDLRQKVVHAVHQRGTSKSEAARLFGISLSSVKRYTRLADRGESLSPRKGGGRAPHSRRDDREAARRRHTYKTGGHRRREAPLPYYALRRQEPQRAHPEEAPQKDGLQPKKRTVGAKERDEFLRAAWKVMVARSLDAHSLVFVDEMGTNISLSPVYGWAKKGRRAHCSVPRNRGKNTTVLASMSVEGMGPSLAVEGATSALVFEAYLERLLAPTLRRGQVVVMDNLSAHKGERVKELIEQRGCELSCICRPTRRTSTP
jgi:transposase